MAERSTIRARTLVPGRASGEALVLDEPLSFWGGVDAESGRVIDVHHPQRGEVVTGRVLVVPAGRGSSSSSSVLAEAVRAGTAPAAIVLGEPDPIIALGVIVAGELYGSRLPIVVAGPEGHRRLRTARRIVVTANEGAATIVVMG